MRDNFNLEFRIWDDKNKCYCTSFFFVNSYGEFVERYPYDEKVDTTKDLILVPSTGVTDINYKMIFAGDILKVGSVKYDDEVYMLIEWDKEICGFAAVPAKKVGQGYVRFLNKGWVNDQEAIVVGNIYENPELSKR